MEAILDKTKLEVVSEYTIGSETARVRAIYDSVPNYESGKISKLLISFDHELTDDLILTLVNSSYSGEFPIFHSFFTDKHYISDITRYVINFFDKQRGGENEN